MNLRETDEEAFVATLHGIDPEKMDKLVKEESKTKQSSTDKDKSTSVGDADAEKELKEKSSETPELSSSMVLSEQENKRNELFATIAKKVNAVADNPLLRLEVRPDVINILI